MTLDSIQYKELVHKWQMFLNTPIIPEQKPSKADTPVLKTARRVIAPQYQGVISTGLLINDDLCLKAF